MILVGQLHFGTEEFTLRGAHVLVDEYENGVVIPEAHWQVILAQLLWYQHLLPLLKLQHHQLLRQLDLIDDALTIVHSLEAFYTHHEVELLLHQLSGLLAELVLQLMLVRLLLEELRLLVQILKYVDALVFLHYLLDIVLFGSIGSQINLAMLYLSILLDLNLHNIILLRQSLV